LSHKEKKKPLKSSLTHDAKEKERNLTAQIAVEAKMFIFGLHVEVLLLLLLQPLSSLVEFTYVVIQEQHLEFVFLCL